MTAPAAPLPVQRRAATPVRARDALAAGALCLAAPAHGELGARLTAATDQIFRGDTVSGGRPVATLDLSWDDPTGLYLAGSVTAVATAQSGVKLLGADENVGYARRLGVGPTLDLGIVNSNYSRAFAGGYHGAYTEAYAGLIGRGLSAHIHYSPNYFRYGVSVVYLDLAGAVRPAPKWRLTAHAGLLTRIEGPHDANAPRSRLDWRLGIARKAGPFDLQLAWAGAGGDAPGYYSYGRYPGEKRRRDRLVLSLTWRP